MDSKQALTQKEVDVSTTPDSDELSYFKDSQVQSLQVKYSNWKMNKAEVFNPDTKEVLYSLDFKMRKPHIRFHAGQDESSELASTTMHLTSTQMDVDVRGRPIALKLRKKLRSDYIFTSPTFQNQEMKWTCKSGWTSQNFVCLDEQQCPVARIKSSAMCMSMKIGTVEFLGSLADHQDAKEEILVTGLSLVYYFSSVNKAAINGSAASAAASSAAVAAAVS